ncbi:helicase RepA family protein [Paradonghicola geojensis]|nr:helicase RepA family protein [Marivivens geojensis]
MRYHFVDLKAAFPIQPISNLVTTDTPRLQNVDKIRTALLEKGKWHYNVLALVASYVHRGLSDEEILFMAPKLTLPGYSVEQTEQDLLGFCNSARAKGFDDHPDFLMFPAKVSPTISGQPLFDHVLDVSLTPPRYLIDEILVENTIAALVAPSYSGKSYVAVDMACSVATGQTYHGKPVTQGSVFCVIGESRTGWRRRINSWCKDKGFTPNRTGMPLHLSKYGLNFRDPDTVNAIKAELRACADIKLIIIDTLARSFGGGNENAAQDMGQFIDACDQLKYEFGVTVLIVHHKGKDTAAGARGSSAFYTALDTSMVINKVGNDIQLTCDKQKEGPEFAPMQFCFVETAADNEPPVLSLVPTSKPKGMKLGKHETLAMQTFLEATKAMSPPRCVHLSDWRSEFHQRHTGDNTKSKDTAFRRARTELVSKGYLDVKDDFYTLGDKATSDDIAKFVA